MFVKKIMVASFISLGLVSSICMAADQGHGAVTMRGSIISTQVPCVITPESIDQTVELGQVSDTVLLENNGSGKSTPRVFSIDLEQCEVTGSNAVSVTFTGTSGKDGRLGITGTASGASVAFTDGSGDVLPLGKPSESFKLNEGNNTLRFATYLQGDGVPGNIKPGDYQAVADFTLSYQ